MDFLDLSRGLPGNGKLLNTPSFNRLVASGVADYLIAKYGAK
jgi:hypothetical protein